LLDELRIGVLGLGRLGTALAQALVGAGLQLTAVATRDLAAANSFSTQLTAAAPRRTQVTAVAAADLAEHAELIFIAVPDARLAPALAELKLEAKHALVHTSGALALDVLPRSARGGVFHPLQAFAPGAGPPRFLGIHIGIEASEATLESQLHELARRLGATPLSLRGVERAAYHAAAVFVSNYVVALHAAATRVWTRAGLPASDARAALLPLSRGALDAIAQHELSEALTGPLARGDLSTLRRHVSALSADTPSLELYRALALELLRLPLALDPATRAQLTQLLVLPPQSD
jgi:predicted short-subunit dehydrogenase-like oxidoreductase (DUF2520 family)